MPCPSANLFGAPGTGLHSYRFLGFAVVDTALTILLAMFTAWLLRGRLFVHLVFWFVLGEVAHYAYGTQSAMLTKLGITACP
jgi:hypothetical protein